MDVGFGVVVQDLSGEIKRGRLGAGREAVISGANVTNHAFPWRKRPRGESAEGHFRHANVEVEEQ